MLVCWSVKGGVGTSVVAAALALGRAGPGGVLLVDLGGDLPCLFGVPDPESAGIAGWLQAGREVPPDALTRLEVPLAPDVALLPRGSGPLASGERAAVLVAVLHADPRPVVIDAGVLAAVVGPDSCDGAGGGGAALGGPGGPATTGLRGQLLAAASSSVLVTRACPLALRRLTDLPAVPTGVVVVRDHHRAVRWIEVAEVVGAPVLAELDVDPAVGAAVDAGLAHRMLPRGFRSALAGVR